MGDNMLKFDEKTQGYCKSKLKNFKIFGLASLKEKDKIIIRDVMTKIEDFSVSNESRKSSEITLEYLNQLLNLSLGDISIFGYDITETLEDTLQMVSFKPSEEESTWKNEILFPSVNLNTTSINGIARHIMYPKNIHPCDEIFLGHEEIHLLKDTNPKEFIHLHTLIEVIPIFYEMLMSEDISYLTQDILAWRIKELKESAEEYKKLEALRKDFSIEDKKYLDMLLLDNSVYHLGFYYASILFNMYQKNPNKILYLVRKVLIHEITTLDLLKILGIYQVPNLEEFDEELYKIKRII